MAARRRTDPVTGRAAVRAWLATRADGTDGPHGPDGTDRTDRTAEAGPAADAVAARAGDVRTAVRFTLEELAAVAPGNAVEVRVPPAGAVQCVPGPRHTRGTPPAVVEMTPEVWLSLATGLVEWSVAVGSGAVRASGERADLGHLLPLAAVRVDG